MNPRRPPAARRTPDAATEPGRPVARARPFPLRAGAVAAVAAAVTVGLVACAEDAPPSVTPADYVAALSAICGETSDRLDALPQPTDEIGVSAFATGVAVAMREEAEAVRALTAPGDLEADHRALIRNTDDQAARWATLGATESTDEAFGDLTREIGELTLGRNDLVEQMGATGCVRAAG